MKKILSLSLLSSVLLFSSCATIFTGTKEKITVTSIPPGAEVTVDGTHRGVTPVEVELKKGSNGQTISLKKEGYEPKIYQPSTNFNPIALLNFLGLVGWIVDGATGAIMKYDQKNIEIKLEPVKN